MRELFHEEVADGLFFHGEAALSSCGEEGVDEAVVPFCGAEVADVSWEVSEASVFHPLPRRVPYARGSFAGNPDFPVLSELLHYLLVERIYVAAPVFCINDEAHPQFKPVVRRNDINKRLHIPAFEKIK